MKIVIRADASLWIGSGHIMRCLVLAESLKTHGFKVIFASLPQEGDMISYVRKRGFDVIALTPPNEKVYPAFESDYLAWLQRPIAVDVNDFLMHVQDADIVITDHYAIGEEWQGLVRSQLNCKVVAIDDLKRLHSADLIIDQTLGRHPEEYSASKSIKTLTGSRYALLKQHFAQLREKALRRKPSNPPRVLISMGGIDQPNATLKVLRSLSCEINTQITVLLSSKAPNYNDVTNWCLAHKNITHIDFTEDMASIMLAHDIAIGAPGTTSWERACLGLPSIIIPLAENQQTISKQLETHQCAVCVSLFDIESELVNAMNNLLKRWNTYYKNNLSICDGLGAKRVALEIAQLSKVASSEEYTFQLAELNDIELVYNWQCHPATRKFALNPNPPQWKEHCSWMKNKLQSFQDYFYLIKAKENHTAVGVVRLDKIKHGHYLVSIFIAPGFYERGIATTALKLLDLTHPNVTLHATVLPENLASQALFRKANYRKETKDKFIRNPIK